MKIRGGQTGSLELTGLLAAQTAAELWMSFVLSPSQMVGDVRKEFISLCCKKKKTLKSSASECCFEHRFSGMWLMTLNTTCSSRFSIFFSSLSQLFIGPIWVIRLPVRLGLRGFSASLIPQVILQHKKPGHCQI